MSRVCLDLYMDIEASHRGLSNWLLIQGRVGEFSKQGGTIHSIKSLKMWEGVTLKARVEGRS